MLQSYEPKTNTVITKNLLLSLANEQQSKRRRKRNITCLDKIEEIRLEYLNILAIDCLWPLKNLVKLKLNNNVIEKIENFESLTNLCELDLSFNRIKKIEHLEKLRNIHILSLYHNEIEVVEGIDHMQYLSILSLGKNNILDLDHILYLRQLKNLRSLQMKGNPCLERNGYMTYLLAFMPQLVYFGYKLIKEKERSEAMEKHRINQSAILLTSEFRLALSNLVEQEEKKLKEEEAMKEEENKIVQLSTSFVEYLNDDCLFQLMYKNDPVGAQLPLLDAEIKSMYEQYKKNFTDVSTELFELGLKEEVVRRSEVSSLMTVMNDLLRRALENNRKMLESVKGKRVEISVRVTQLLREAAVRSEDGEIDDETVDGIDKVARKLSREFNSYADLVWEKIMRNGLITHEGIRDMVTRFETNIEEIVGGFLEAAQDLFTRMRNFETEYSDALLPIMLNLVNNIEEGSKDLLSELLTTANTDSAHTLITDSHYKHMQVIDDRQDRLTQRLKDWQKGFVKKLTKDEVIRHRDRILEVKHFLDTQRADVSVDKLLGQQYSQLQETEEGEEEEEEAVGNYGEENEDSDED